MEYRQRTNIIIGQSQLAPRHLICRGNLQGILIRRCCIPGLFVSLSIHYFIIGDSFLILYPINIKSYWLCFSMFYDQPQHGKINLKVFKIFSKSRGEKHRCLFPILNKILYTVFCRYRVGSVGS